MNGKENAHKEQKKNLKQDYHQPSGNKISINKTHFTKNEKLSFQN